MKSTLKTLAFCLVQIGLCLSCLAQGTAFTYQGYLKLNGVPANGQYLFTYLIYDASTGGTPLGYGGEVNANVTNGLFSISVDPLLTNVYTGAPRWLQLWVQSSTETNATLLLPRQPLSPTPYAIFAGTASNALNAASTPLAGTAGFATNASSAGTATNFSGSLSGDVTGTQSSTVVAKVGGQTAANVASGVIAANGATPNNQTNTIVMRDNSGNFSAGSLTLSGTMFLPNPASILTGPAKLLFADQNNNTFLGIYTGNSSLTGVNNSVFGNQTLTRVAGGNENVAVGSYSLQQNISGSANTVVGNHVMLNSTSSSYNTALGQYALGFLVTGYENTALGYGAGLNTYYGGTNLFLGTSAGINLSHGTNDVYIASFGGGPNESGVIRIGMVGTHTDTYLAGLTHVTAPGFIAMDTESASTAGTWFNLGNTASGGTNWALISTASGNGEGAGKLLFNTCATVGAVSGNTLTLTPNGNVGIDNVNPVTPLQVQNARCDGNVWINSSDRNLKENFAPIQPETVLAKVAALPITEWKYKNEPAGIKHLGPVAQDFMAAFGLGASDKAIGTVDEGGVALAAIQGLNEKLKEKDGEIAALKQRLDRLEKLLEKQSSIPAPDSTK